MTAISLAARDSATMLRRNLKRQVRYPSILLAQIMLPVVFLLLFAFVFGSTMGAGLPGSAAGAGRAEYLAFIMPGVLLLAVAGTGQSVAISVAMDTTAGIMARFRTMAISRSSVLTGHVVGALLQTMVAVPVVLGIAVAVGFRPEAGPLGWLGVAGTVAMTAFAVIWLCTALALASKTVEGASNAPMPLMILPFLGSGFVPTETLPVGLRWFAEHQPFTPIMDLLRALLLDQPVGSSAWPAVAWCAGIALVGYLWARRLSAREPAA
jgi:ABC-2 type transport system permease protein